MLRGKTYASKICPQNKTIFCQHVVMQNRSLYMLHPGRGRYPYLLLIPINLMTRNKNEAEAWEAIQTNVSISFTSETQQETLSGCARSALSHLFPQQLVGLKGERGCCSRLITDAQRLCHKFLLQIRPLLWQKIRRRGQKTTRNNKATNNASR